MKRFICFLFLLILIPVFAFAEVSSDDVCGKWSFYWDIRTLPSELQDVMDDSIMSYELYLFPDGSSNMTKMSMNKKEKVDFSLGALSGVWIMDGNNLVIRVSDFTYKAVYDNGILNVYFTEKIYLPFVRIDQSELMYKQVVH